MKKTVHEFIHRGLTACGFGPIVLAVVYLVLEQKNAIDVLTVHQVCLGILSLTALAFLAGGLNIVYRIERLPLMAAILIHGSALYGGYLITYLLNGWLKCGVTPFLVFTVIFVLGFVAIWAVIYLTTKKRIKAINEQLKLKQHSDLSR